MRKANDLCSVQSGKHKNREKFGGRQQLAAFLRFAGENFGNPYIDFVFPEFYNLKLVKI